MYNIQVSEECIENLKIIFRTHPSLKRKIKIIKENLKETGIRNHYDIRKIQNGYFRLKIPPYRIIIKVHKETIYLENIFKRKGISDYKKYQ